MSVIYCFLLCLVLNKFLSKRWEILKTFVEEDTFLTIFILNFWNENKINKIIKVIKKEIEVYHICTPILAVSYTVLKKIRKCEKLYYFKLKIDSIVDIINLLGVTKGVSVRTSLKKGKIKKKIWIFFSEKIKNINPLIYFEILPVLFNIHKVYPLYTFGMFSHGKKLQI